MFNSSSSSHTSIKTPTDNKMKCKFCDEYMINIHSSWSSFVCINCGGKCFIECDDRHVPINGNAHHCRVVKEAIKVTWTKVPVEG